MVRPDPVTTAVFVYGSLRPGEPAHPRHLSGRILTATPARITGLALFVDQRRHGYAIAGDGELVGEVLNVDPTQWIETLADLDQYAGHPAHYRRAETFARLPNNQHVHVWIYLAGLTINHAAIVRVPGDDWRLR